LCKPRTNTLFTFMKKLPFILFTLFICCVASAKDISNISWTKIDENDDYATYIAPSQSAMAESNNPLNIWLSNWGVTIDNDWKLLYLVLNLHHTEGNSYLIPQAINCTSKEYRCNMITLYEKHFAQGDVINQMIPRNLAICSIKHLPVEKIMDYVCQR